MATELQSARLTLRLDTAEAEKSLDQIEAEQTKRAGGGSPSATTGSVTRPRESSAAAPVLAPSATREPVPEPADVPGDARAAAMPAKRGGSPIPGASAPMPATAGEAVTIAREETKAAFAKIAELQKFAPRTAEAAAGLGSQLAQSGGAALSARGLAAAGPAGIVAAAAIAGAAYAAPRAASYQGLIEGITGLPRGGGFGGILGTFGSEITEGWNAVASRFEAVDQTMEEIADIAQAAHTAGGAVDIAWLKSFAGDLYTVNQVRARGLRDKQTDNDVVRYTASGDLVRRVMADLIAGGAH